ncbi:non-ribosomal peptide synthetase [Saccharopolyspora tripterygii]
MTAAQISPNQTASDSVALTESQLGLLVVHRSVRAGNLYNVVVELELDPGCSGPQVRSALASVMAVQPALRTGLRDHPAPHSTLIDLPENQAPLRMTQVPAENFDPQRGFLVDELANTSFDLASPPLLRAVHLHAADGSRAVLLLVVHHTVFDGFSLRPLVEDLNRALTGELDVDGLRSPRERAYRRELAAQVGAVEAPEVDDLTRGLAESLRWTTPTTLHPRPNRPAATDFAGDRLAIALSAQQSEMIDETCRKLGITAFTFFSAVYAAVLARHGGQDSAVFGAPLMARRTVGSFELCGFFVNTLPVAIDVPWRSGFAQFVREHVAPRIAAVKAAAAVPFTRIVRDVAPERSGNRNPLFSCMLAMQDSTSAESDSPVRGVREHGTGTAKFDLWLGVTPTRDGWLLELEHDVALLPKPVVAGIAASLRAALSAVTADTDVVLDELFEDADLDQAAAVEGPSPAAADLDSWLREACSRNADQVAVDEGGRKTCYAELDAEAAAMASRLNEAGVVPGAVVGLATETLLDTIVTILAALRLRAAYLPLDPSLPEDRLGYMLAKAECRIAVSHSPIPGTRIVTPGGNGQGASAPDPGPRGEQDPVYLMFTSGSTGNPKGVLMHNGPLVNLTAWQIQALDMTTSTRFLQYAPSGFDVSFQEIVPTLVTGGTVVARDGVDRRDFPRLVTHVRDERVSHVYLPVAALAPFVHAVEAAGEPLSNVRKLCVSGEQLVATDEIRSFFAQRPHIDLVNLYGPTETHAVTTFSPTETGNWESHVPIGRPISGVSAQVVDRTGHLAPPGVMGELLLGGRCPAIGYINDHDRTQERFLPDPYRPHDGRRYRTGDQAMWSAEGQLVFLGRNDDQVKIRGFRVELGEIEVAAQSLPGVQLAVAAVAGEASARRLLLFVTAASGTCPDPVAVRRVLAEALPNYMVPAAVHVVESIPTTGNGKVDRAALVSTADLLDECRGPRTAASISADSIEAWLQRTWAELLGDLPAVDESLVELGAHSLNTLTVLAQVHEEYGAQPTILEFFERPTVAAMAVTLRELGAER